MPSPDSFRFLHAADLHLDSPLRGLARRGEMAGAFLEASRRALENLVEAAIHHQVAFVVIAGDIFDGDWKDFSTGQFFIRQMGRLAQADIRVFTLRGNHDAASVITKDLPIPRNVHIFSEDAAETVTMPELNVALHGHGFATRHVPRNIALDYPAARPGHFNIGVLHTSLTGREGHEVYAPCSIPDLERSGYDYWALGHVHQREVVKNERPAIVYPGNLQGRHARETGPKGATLVEVQGGNITALTALTLDAARFERLEIDLSGVTNMGSLHQLARTALLAAVEGAEGRPLAARLVLKGETPLHAHLLAHPGQIFEEMMALAAEAGTDVMVEKVRLHTSDPQPHVSLSVTGFDAFLDEVAADPDFLAEISGTLDTLRQKSPPHLPPFDELGPDGMDGLARRAIMAARDAILAHLGDDAPAADLPADDQDENTAEARS
ncbi:metallophosphoesterase family protein [Xanthobacter sp. TB0139]|uniref:metallophosphoesterase family protein n=1 Tax=Xanthobacter sp. TB0139 TaxID=3459178 RepID=UPI00403A4269